MKREKRKPDEGKLGNVEYAASKNNIRQKERKTKIDEKENTKIDEKEKNKN
jgi:hypothetical protein